ncbi:MAG: hypothetical protein ABJB40_00460 [Acidobacteriota bacterium]
MRNTVFGLICLILFSGSIYAQVSPNPVADAEIRDTDSIRMRSLALEQAKREANQLHATVNPKIPEAKFAVIKDDFENIQKLESLIVKTYTAGKKINVDKISELALAIKKRAGRLRSNFFDIRDETDVDPPPQDLTRKSVRDLIIDLDNALTVFVTSPMFTSPTVVDATENAKAEVNLKQLIKLSAALNIEATKLAKALN